MEKIDMSSANSFIVDERSLPRSFTYIKKSNDPKIKPWGTPASIADHDDDALCLQVRTHSNSCPGPRYSTRPITSAVADEVTWCHTRHWLAIVIYPYIICHTSLILRNQSCLRGDFLRLWYLIGFLNKSST